MDTILNRKALPLLLDKWLMWTPGIIHQKKRLVTNTIEYTVTIFKRLSSEHIAELPDKDCFLEYWGLGNTDFQLLWWFN